MSNVTIFLTTINRVREVEILIKHYEKQKIKCPIIIGDSSNKTNFIKLKKLVNNSKHKNIQIFNNKNIRQVEFFYFILKKVKTKYAIYSGDDDYYDLSLINKELKNIKKKKTINLKSYALELLDYKFDNLTLGYSKEIIHEDYRERLRELSYNYYSLMFSLTSTQNWLNAVKYGLNFKSKIISSEIAICFKLLQISKVYKSKNYCLLRTYEPRNKVKIEELRRKSDSQDIYQLEIYKVLLDFGLDANELKNFLTYENLDISRKISSNINEYFIKQNYKLSEILHKILNYYLFDQFENIDETDLIYWGNYSNFELCFNNYIKKNLISKKIILLTPRDTKKYIDFFSKNKITCHVLHVDEYNQFENFDKNSLILRSLRGRINNYFSISNFLPLEKLIIAFCTPKNKFIYWAHITNYLNHPFYTNSLIKKLHFPNNIRFALIKFIYQFYIFYKNKSFYFNNSNHSKKAKTLIAEINLSQGNLSQKNYVEQNTIKNSSVNLYDKIKSQFKSSKLMQFKNYKILKPIKILLFLNLKLISVISISLKKIIKKIREYFFPNPRKEFVKLLQGKDYGNISKFLYDYIKFDYNNLDDFHTRSNVFYMRFVGENLFLDAFSKLDLSQIEKSKLSKINRRKFEINHIDYINQLGKLKDLNIYLMSDLEILILKKIYSKSAGLTFNKMKFSSSKKVSRNNKKGLITFSVGLIPENNYEITELAKELRFFVKKYKINQLYFRPHPAEDMNKIKYFLKNFNLKYKTNVILHKNNLPFFKDQRNFKALFTSISATIIELSDERKQNVCLSSSISSKQYSDLRLFNKFFPNIEII